MCGFRICTADEPGRCESVCLLTPRAWVRAAVLPTASRFRANPGSRQEEVWCLGSNSGAFEGSRQGAGRRLAVPGSQVQLSSILGDNIYNVPSPRIIPPACPPSVFPADGFSRLLNNQLGSEAPGLTGCCPSGPSLLSRMPEVLGDQNTKLGHPRLFSRGTEREVPKLEAKTGGEVERLSSGTEVGRQLT